MLGTNSVPQGQVRSGWDKAEAPALDTATFSASSRVSLVQICLPESKTHAYLVSVSPLHPSPISSTEWGFSKCPRCLPRPLGQPTATAASLEGLGIGSR